MKISQLKKTLYTVKLKFIKGDSSSKTSVAPTLSQYGLNLREFNGLFDAKSYFVLDGFETGCVFNVNQGKIVNFSLKDPSSSFYIKNMSVSKLSTDSLSSKDKLKFLYEISVLKSNKRSLSSLSLYTICKIQKSVLYSFNTKL